MQEDAGGQQQGRHGRAGDQAFAAKGALQQGQVGRFHRPHQARRARVAFGQQQRGEHGNDGQRQQQRGGQREEDGQRHGGEQLAFQALQGQQGQEDDHDHQHAGADGQRDFAHGPVNAVQARHARLRVGAMGLDVFHHHHGGVDQHADGDGQAAQRHQVGAQAIRLHQQEGAQRRQRQDAGDHQRRAQLAQEDSQQHDDQHRRFGQRARDAGHGPLHQLAAVVEGADAGALGQAGTERVEARAHLPHHLLRIGAAHGQHQRLHGFAAPVLGDGAVARQLADAHRGHLAHVHGHATAPGDADGAHVVQRADARVAADQQRLLAAAQAARAVAAVVRFQRLLQLRQRQAARGQGGQVGHHFEAAHHAAERIDVGHAGDVAQLGADGPFEQRALFHQAQGAFDGEHEDFAQRRGDGRQAAADGGGQVLQHAGQPFADLLARPEDVRAFLEVQRDVGDRIFGLRAQHGLARDAQQFLLDGGDDARLDFFRRHAGRLQDQLDLGTGDIGKGVDGQRAERLHAGRRHQRGQHQHQQALRQRQGDEAGQHHWPPWAGASDAGPRPLQLPLRTARPRTATASPAASAPRAQTMPPPAGVACTGVAAKPLPLATKT